MFSALHHNVSSEPSNTPHSCSCRRLLCLRATHSNLYCCFVLQGKRLHELAREGVTVERQARPVTVTRFDVHRSVCGDWRCIFGHLAARTAGLCG
jgi:hypothetical protein